MRLFTSNSTHFASTISGPELAAWFAAEEKAPATRRAYASDIRHFTDWCQIRALLPLPALSTTVATYLADEAEQGRKSSTIGRRVAAIRDAHRANGLKPPTETESVKAVLRGIRRLIGTACNRKRPATAEIAKAMARCVPVDDLAGKRDRAIILLGFAGAFRRSELVALNIADLEIVKGGLKVIIRRSKTDQEGEGYLLGIPYGAVECPVKAVIDWIQASRIREGALFRSINHRKLISTNRLTDKSVANVIKKYAALLGLEARHFSGHSLRSGFLTSAAENGASIFKMMDLSRHKSADSLRGYIRDAELFNRHAGGALL